MVDPPGTVANRLFVFLPGTGGPPGGYRHILRNAAAGGYHALGLAYRNEVAVNDLCTVAEHGCHAAVREEILTGEDLSPLVEVGRADSIEHRLSAALVHLGWEQYLDGDALRWSDIAVAGHSQGGGHAAFIASLHEVHRASLFAASEPADWTGEALATPAARIYGFIHVDDPYYASMTSSWERLGIPGALVDVDGLAWPFEDSHRLQTTFAVSAEDAHGAVAADPRTPMDGDLPVYRDVWCAVIGP
ncbi:MAG: hypothetical protein IAG13_01270 [Deltaproteobacteria bacterium]|nr:hypothetical protein [Nannocystaceae bacterium]